MSRLKVMGQQVLMTIPNHHFNPDMRKGYRRPLGAASWTILLANASSA